MTRRAGRFDSPLAPALLVLGCLAVFWCAVLAAAAANPGYSHRRDYVSTLAARGAEDAWLGMLAIGAAALAMLAAAVLLRRLSRAAAVLTGLAGTGFLVVAFARLDCSKGAAGCGLGGRFEVSGSVEIAHWTATTVSSVLLIAAIGSTGVALLRLRHRLAGILTVLAAAATSSAFLATGGDSPGWIQRLGIVVATGWLAALAVVVLARSRVFTSKSPAS